MFNKLISRHLDEIKNAGYENNCIFVYKGFPVNFLIELNKIFPLLNNKNKVFTSGKIDLEKINKNINFSVKRLLNKNKGRYILTYEEFILLSQKIDLSMYDGKFIVFENNLCNEYPNQSTEKFIDIEQAVEEGSLDFKENELFNYFYATSSVNKNINLIQYRDINLAGINNVGIKHFFSEQIIGTALRYEETETEQQFKDKIIIFPASPEYMELKYKLFVKRHIDSSVLFETDPVTIQNKQYHNELKILQYIFKENNVEFKIIVKKNILNNNYRDAFLTILKKYWKNDNFRELIFYKNPDISADKIMVSQGAVLEEIVTQCEKAQKTNDFSDIFLTSPTGSGKSVLFQIPAIFLAEKYGLMTIVVSPLKALMYDQVYALKNICPRCGSQNTADVQCGVIGRTMNISAATTKFKLILNGPKPGGYFCNVCNEFFNFKGKNLKPIKKKIKKKILR